MPLSLTLLSPYPTHLSIFLPLFSLACSLSFFSLSMVSLYLYVFCPTFIPLSISPLSQSGLLVSLSSLLPLSSSLLFYFSIILILLLFIFFLRLSSTHIFFLFSLIPNLSFFILTYSNISLLPPHLSHSFSFFLLLR